MDNISKPFPLLRLPRLVLDEVFIMMRPFELINFSMVSSKSKIIIKCFLRTKRNLEYSLEVNTREEPKVAIVMSKSNFDYRMTSVKEKHNKKEYVETRDNFKYDRIWIYSENMISDWMKLIKIVMELFTFKRHLVVFRPDSFLDQNKSIIDFIKFQVPTVDACLIVGETPADREVEHFLKNVNVTGSLVMDSRLTDQFQLKTVKAFETLSIYYGNWVNYNQFINLKGYEIEIKNSKITCAELNLFLRSWMSFSAHRNLESLMIRINEPVSIDVIFNLPHEIIHFDSNRQGRTARNEIVHLRGGIDIRRNDGTTATIYFERDNNQIMLRMTVSYLIV
ncbi:hypothetical protein CRE_22837 [Caenorhabditis remanei]|uniref:F-box domain-containing protein n=1 Tax=Caenorhabditis remanei TaxID=31234 RepID=E3MHH3_CAERE|nr:hypothetical protein CRE_22837 [Caenorhabditis remanei]